MKKLSVIFLGCLLAVLLSAENDGYGMVLEDDSTTLKKSFALEKRFGSIKKKTEETPQYVPGEVIVKFKEGATPSQALQTSNLEPKAIERVYSTKPVTSKFIKDYKLEKDSDGWYSFIGKGYKEVSDIPDEEIFHEAYKKMNVTEQSLYRTYKVELPEDISVEMAIKQLSESPAIEYAEPNCIVKTSFVPNDHYYTSAGSWGQAYDDLWGLKKLECEQAWDITQGEGVVVAVIDTGVDYNHEDIAANIWINENEIPNNNIDDDNNGYVDDVKGWDFAYNDKDPMDGDGHGTHVAGTIAAVGNNNIGVIGVAPRAKIMAVKGLSDNGSGYVSTLCKAVKYAYENGANITNNSWGALGTSKALEDVFNAAYQAGSLSVAAAGNSNMDVSMFTPASIDSVIAVAASTQNDEKCSFSNSGLLIDVTAPGGGYVNEAGGGSWDQYNILSTMSANAGLARAYPQLQVSAGYFRLAGTSMACPHVVGLAALIKSAYPVDSPDAIRGRIMAGADNIDHLNPGFEGLLGMGRINAFKSLTADATVLLKITKVEKDNMYPGSEANIFIYLKSQWEDALNTVATLKTSHPLVTINQGTQLYGDILTSQTHRNSEAFIVSLPPTFPHGDIINFTLTLSCDGGYQKILSFDTSVGFFDDVSAPSNLPTVDPAVPIFTTFSDYDNDGYPDIYYSGWLEDRLYRNMRDGSFVDVTDEAGIVLTGLPNGHIFVDIDNDGNRDLIVSGVDYGEAEKRIFLNNGNGTFTDITEEAGDVAELYLGSIAMDYNNDGFADIYNGKGFMKNNKDNTFTWVPASVIGLAPYGRGIVNQLVALDYDNDGFQDILIPVSYQNTTRLCRNNGDGTFTDVTEIALPPIKDIDSTNGIAVAAADFNNDGYIDIFVGTFVNDAGTMVYSLLFKNKGNGTFEDISIQAGNVNEGGWGFWWGTDFFDYDNDGDLDLYITNEAFAFKNTHVLYRNNGDETFTEVTDIAFPRQIRPSTGAACIGDYDADGALDIYAPGSRYYPDSLPGGLLRNLSGTRNNWIKIRLEGTISNRDAYGAKIHVTTGNLTQLREVHTSPVQTQPIHFGLEQSTQIDEITVRWPSGIAQHLYNVGINQVLTINEPLPPSPDIILKNIELAVRAHAFNFFDKRFHPEKYDANFDLNNDGWITVTDELRVRNIHIISQAQFDMAYSKLMAAVTERLGLTPADTKFVAAFDTDLDDDIDSYDYGRIQYVLRGTR